VERKAHKAEKRLSGLERFEEVSFRCVTQRELRGLYKQATEAVEANFEMVKKISLPRIPGVQQALLGLLPAGELVQRVLTDDGGGIRKSLFHENVRDFQGYNDVNEKIRGTLSDAEHKQRFAVLNNGITIVTRELMVAGDEIRIKDFQIVNGCQTCHVLFDERTRLTDAVQVSVRLVHSQDEDVIGGIVAATNLQTAVSEEMLSAREDFHKELEEFFAHQPEARRLYYERRSRQYSSRQDVPKSRIISMSQLARAYLATFLDEPDRVGHFKEVLEKRKDYLFRSDHQPAAYYSAAAAYYRLEALIHNRRIPSDYNPARYHILSAMKMQVIGSGSLPRAPKAAAASCEKLLEIVWDPPACERLVIDLLPAVQKSIDAERAAGTPLSEAVRTRRFAERVRREILGGTAR
jgi:AIPR protein